MDNWCILALGIAAAPAQLVNLGWSWLLDNLGGLREWWDQQAGVVKRLLYAGSCAAVGVGAYFAAQALACADLPDLAAALYIILLAALGYLGGAFAHEQRKF